MIVYLDLLIILNLFFDFVLLMLVNIILKRYVSFLRVLLGAGIGSVSILILWYSMSSVVLFLFKFIISLLMILVTFKYKNLKYFFNNIFYLYFSSILLGGILYYLNIEFSYINEKFVFYDKGLSINYIFIIIISPLILYSLIFLNRKRKNILNNIYEVEFVLNKIKYNIKGFYDTGNNLVDPYFSRPIILINYNIIKDNIGNKIIYVPYRVVNNKSILECIKIKRIKIGNYNYKNVLLGISYGEFHIDNVDCILNNNTKGEI